MDQSLVGVDPIWNIVYPYPYISIVGYDYMA